MLYKLTGDHVVEEQAFYEHPHEHRGFGILEQSVAGLAKDRLQTKERIFFRVDFKRRPSSPQQPIFSLYGVSQRKQAT